VICENWALGCIATLQASLRLGVPTIATRSFPDMSADLSSMSWRAEGVHEESYGDIRARESALVEALESSIAVRKAQERDPSVNLVCYDDEEISRGRS